MNIFQAKNENLSAGEFKPTPLERLVSLTSALDHTATLSDMEDQAVLTSLQLIRAGRVSGRS